MWNFLYKIGLLLVDGYWPETEWRVRRKVKVFDRAAHINKNREWLAKQWNRPISDPEYRAVFGYWP